MPAPVKLRQLYTNKQTGFSTFGFTVPQHIAKVFFQKTISNTGAVSAIKFTYSQSGNAITYTLVTKTGGEINY